MADIRETFDLAHKVLVVSSELMEAFGGFLHRVRRPDAFDGSAPSECPTPARLWGRWQELHSLAEQLEVSYLYDPASKDDILRALSTRPQVPVPDMLNVVADTHVEAVFLIGSRIAFGLAPACGMMGTSYDVIDRQPRFASECEQVANRLRDYLPNGHVASDTLTYLRRAVAIEEATCEAFLNPSATPPQHDKNKPWNEADATPPIEYAFGPLTGTKKQIAEWVMQDDDPRNLDTKLSNGVYWGRKDKRTQSSVWFRTKEKFAEANVRRLGDAK